MLNVILQTCNEPRVLDLTIENITNELKSVEGAELFLPKRWWGSMPANDNDFICYLESDCLVSSGYFSSMIGLFKKNPYYRKLAMLSPAVGVNYWHEKFYGYYYDSEWTDHTREKISVKSKRLYPIRAKKSSSPYSVQVGYVPGSIIRISALKDIVKRTQGISDMRELSSKVSLALWESNRRISINPNATYVTTDTKAGDKADFSPHIPTKIWNMFTEEQI